MKRKRSSFFAAPIVNRQHGGAQLCAVVLVTVIGFLNGCSKTDEQPAAAEAASESASRVKHGDNVETIVTLSEAEQKQIGLKTETIEPGQISPEIKGYGRVLDPTPLISMANDLAAARAAYVVSSNEFARLETLSAQNNASVRALQAAQAQAQRDELAVSSAQAQLALTWGTIASNENDLRLLAQSLISKDAALARIDLPAGEFLETPPEQARLVALGEPKPVEARFLSKVPAVDPQTQGQGFLFLVNSNKVGIAPGVAIEGFLKMPGPPLNGTTVPRESVLRYQGAHWIYVETDGTNFTRRLVSLDWPVARGWFSTNGVAAGDRVVTVGAQTILSAELTAGGAGEVGD